MASDTVDRTDLPAGIDSSDRDALARARAVSHLLDDAVRVPGTQIRFGLDPVLGILPVSGDAVAAVASLYVVLKGIEIGLPAGEVLKMVGLVASEFVIGSIPVLGTLIDAGWKVNSRNVDRMESYLENRASGSSESTAPEASPAHD